MNFDPSELPKADPLLQDVLRQAAAQDRVRVVMTLDVDAVRLPDRAKRPAAKAPPRRSTLGDAASSAALPRPKASVRQQLIDRRRAQLAAKLRPLLSSLRELSLKVSGGTLGRVVVAEGTAANILAGLKLPGVSSATLDRPIHLDPSTEATPSPRRSPSAP